MNSAMVWTLLFGAVGGVANCILVHDGFSLPRVVKKETGEILLTPGFAGPLLLGMIAALATYLLGASKLEEASQHGIALISGLGGGNVLTSLLQRQQTAILGEKVQQMEQTLKNLKPTRGVQDGSKR